MSDNCSCARAESQVAVCHTLPAVQDMFVLSACEQIVSKNAAFLATSDMAFRYRTLYNLLKIDISAEKELLLGEQDLISQVFRMF